MQYNFHKISHLHTAYNISEMVLADLTIPIKKIMPAQSQASPPNPWHAGNILPAT
jgi:hypothetical protein